MNPNSIQTAQITQSPDKGNPPPQYSENSAVKLDLKKRVALRSLT